MLFVFNNHCICVPVLVLEAQQPERQSLSTVETQSITYSRGGDDEQTVTISVASTMHQMAVFSEDGVQGTVLGIYTIINKSFRTHAGLCNMISRQHYSKHMLYYSLYFGFSYCT